MMGKTLLSNNLLEFSPFRVKIVFSLLLIVQKWGKNKLEPFRQIENSQIECCQYYLDARSPAKNNVHIGMYQK